MVKAQAAQNKAPALSYQDRKVLVTSSLSSLEAGNEMNNIASFVIRVALAAAITWMIYTIACGGVEQKNSGVWGEITPVGVIKSLKPEYPTYPDILKSYRLRGCYYPCYKVA